VGGKALDQRIRQGPGTATLAETPARRAFSSCRFTRATSGPTKARKVSFGSYVCRNGHSRFSILPSVGFGPA
jgi:hypothetical protein